MLITTTEFAPLARGLAKTLGMPNLNIVTIPHPYSWSGLTRDDVKERAAGVFGAVVSGLTRATAEPIPS
ncbi:MAG: hypothetical protein HYX92_21100 [Chloroflexi bacterium]|nr:hypothetical protein [Chloroflexota bacterium]